jgi:hypothetical protein
MEGIKGIFLHLANGFPIPYIPFIPVILSFEI